MNTTPTTHRIQKIHFWTPELVKNFCVDLGAYTCGCNAEYDEMLEYVTYHDPEEPQNVYIVARDILEHSSDELNAKMPHILSCGFRSTEKSVAARLSDFEENEGEENIGFDSILFVTPGEARDTRLLGKLGQVSIFRA